MHNFNRNNFRFDWVLIDELAIGTPPAEKEEIKFLKEKGIKSILNLCTELESPLIKEVEESFYQKRLVLPDHKKKEVPSKIQLKMGLNYV